MPKQIVEQVNNPNIGKIVISTTVSRRDWEYCKRNGLMWSRMLENAISIHREAMEQGETDVKFWKKRIERLKDHIDKYSDYLDKKGLTEDFCNT